MASASSASPKPARFNRAQRRRVELREPALSRHAQVANLGELLEEPRVDLRDVVNLLDGPAALQRAEEIPHAPIVRHGQPLAQRRIVFVVEVGLGPKSSPLFPSSSDLTPFMNASLKVRPMAIASPTDFIWVVSVRSACGNFSKFQRGILTTT